ncbi:hypothetical protein [Falsiroseomonas sp. HW251]|uniref:hypothetical protein n=1 Tax=Falsiroseomonas sp. HW251 TaxID=3390998 RepID=UPI003D3157C6
MRNMVFAMLLLAVALAGATALERLGVEHSLALLALVGGAGGLAGGIAMELLREGSRG